VAKTIQQARIAKGFKTQKDLATAIGVPANVINSYESGKAIPDNAVLQKLRKVLGVRLK
jgi:putative transcription factor